MQIAATGGTVESAGSGRAAFDASWATLPGVSAPSSVVRSVIRTARSSANSFDSRLIDRFASSAATLPVTLCMLEVIRDVHDETGLVIGMKPAGGIRTAKQAVQYLCVLHETLGVDWMTPDLFRFGASSLLNDVLLQLRKQRTGIYRSPDEFTLD